MISESKFKPTGVVTATLFDKYGNIKQKEVSTNMVVTTGCELIASRLSAVNPIDLPCCMAVGTGTGDTEISMTGLKAEVAGSRTKFDVLPSEPEGSENRYPTRDGAVVTYVTTFPEGVGVGALVEVGIFNNMTKGEGVMLNRVKFPIITKESSDTLIVQWAVTIS